MSGEPIAVLVVASDRPDYLRRCLASIARHDDEPGRLVIVSHDGKDTRVRSVVDDFAGKARYLAFREKVTAPPRWARLRRLRILRRLFRDHPIYFRIAQHYGWAFRRIFDDFGFDRVIVLEDDLEIAPDFFGYMRAGATVLGQDPTIWTVSAWNDNGYAGLIEDATRLYRSDFFPGLGWLMTRRLWQEVQDEWPATYWDDWLRWFLQRRRGAVICPEVSRTYNFGRDGTAGPEHFDIHLETITLNEAPTDFEGMDLQHLVKAAYDAAFHDAVGRAKTVDVETALAASGGVDQRIVYLDEESYAEIARRFGLWPTFTAGIPRGSYQGVVSFPFKGRRIFLVSLKYIIGGGSQASDEGRVPAPALGKVATFCAKLGLDR
jgi:alpha-1,3-mannosyl-glycoprotein beta-1,2-N-acetylglucosaminyltransferase